MVGHGHVRTSSVPPRPVQRFNITLIALNGLISEGSPFMIVGERISYHSVILDYLFVCFALLFQGSPLGRNIATAFLMFM